MIDVIIPAYLPEEKYLHLLNRALSSLEKQTYKDFEVQLILNGLYESKEAVLPQIIYNGKINIHDMKQKTSSAIARNYGIKNTNRKYICYIDVDDQYESEKLEKQLEFMEANNHVGVLGTRTKYLKNGEICPPKFVETDHETHEQIKQVIKYDNIMFHGSLMLRRDIFNQYGLFYNETQKAGTYWEQYERNMWEDWDLWIRMIEAGIIFHNLREPLYIWTLGTSVDR